MTPTACAKEMLPYAGPLHTAPNGKRGYLYMGFELDGNGKSILRDLERRTPLIVQQELYFDEEMPEMPCVYILSSGGPNVDGDRYEQHFVVRRDAFAHVSTGAATKLAEMRRNYSGLVQRFDLEAGAYLEYLPEPIIPCRHTRYHVDTTIRIDPTATLFYAEIYLSGRRYFGEGERFCYDISVGQDAGRTARRRTALSGKIHHPTRPHITGRARRDERLRHLRERCRADAARQGRVPLRTDEGLHRPRTSSGRRRYTVAERLWAELQGARRRHRHRETACTQFLQRCTPLRQGSPPTGRISVEDINPTVTHTIQENNYLTNKKWKHKRLRRWKHPAKIHSISLQGCCAAQGR